MMRSRVNLTLAVAACALAMLTAVSATRVLADDAAAGHGEEDPGHTTVAGEAAAEEHAEGGGGPLAWNTDLAIWTGVIFLVLFGVLYYFAWGPIREGLDRREQRIADDIAAAQKTNEEARALLAQYEQKLSESQNEVRAILDEARRDAEHTQREILEKAAGEADVVRDRAKREIETATAQALKELAETSSKLAVDLAGKILSAELDTRKHSGLIQEAMSSFPKGGASEN